ncbi:uncharacterized protein MKK02DRAFT_37533 [Dioszegia hungarica]|uniref:Uncharacterized protein n=1 Tax=Dioszegia hungarica TaxID=4972 RepID=A0AA38H5Z6_9TREE|nr:uncharacterized protein MKK02DRAFT_37533 [Dioszegia hungarica]KAI9634653.1 hypothetical protein MKK02DRAFT_37533 [Dioszegia hungarica]
MLHLAVLLSALACLVPDLAYGGHTVSVRSKSGSAVNFIGRDGPGSRQWSGTQTGPYESAEGDPWRRPSGPGGDASAPFEAKFAVEIDQAVGTVDCHLNGTTIGLGEDVVFEFKQGTNYLSDCYEEGDLVWVVCHDKNNRPADCIKPGW